MGLFDFYAKAGDYATPDPSALARAGESGRRHSGYHKRIVLVSCIFGVLGAVPGIIFLVVAAGVAKAGNDLIGLLFAPFMFGAAGLLFGVAVACLFAPRDFLTGPLGEKWMKLIGTKSVLVARIVCLIFGLIIMAPFVAVGLVVAFAK